MGMPMSSFSEEKKILGWLEKGSILSIVYNQCIYFSQKYGTQPTEICINHKLYDQLVMEAGRLGKIYHTMDRAYGGTKFLKLPGFADPVPLVSFIATKKQLDTRPDMEWLMLSHAARKLVESL